MAPRRNKTSLAVRARRAEKSLLRRLRRLVHYQLVIPLKRSRHPPEYTARGVAVGVALGLTPTVGIQMALAVAVWFLARRLFNWDFNAILACAWTWISNVVTMVPMYYVLYVAGQAMLGRWDDVWGYHIFVAEFRAALHPGGRAPDWIDFDYVAPGVGHWFASLLHYFVADLFLVMLLGSVPFVVVGGWLSYRWSLRFAMHHREARRRRHAEVRTRRKPGSRGAAAAS
jgi:uncharacterized protein (DUF2062 family)